MIKYLFALLLFFAAYCMEMSAQSTIFLDLDSAKVYALEHNRMLQNAGNAVDDAKYKIWETTAAGLPQASATVDYSYLFNYEIQFSFGDNTGVEFTDDQRALLDDGDMLILGALNNMFGSSEGVVLDHQSNAKLQVSQLIFSGSFIVGLQVSKLYKKVTEKNYEKTERDIKEQVSNSYYLCLVAEMSEDILHKSLDNLKKVQKNTEMLASVGMAEQLDADQFSVQVTSVENTLKITERNKELAYGLLRIQLGLETDEEIELTDSLEIFIGKINRETAYSNIFNLNNNLEYQILDNQLKIAEKQVSVEQMSYLPTVSGFYSYTKKIIAPGFDMTPPNVVGLNVSVPIFSSGMRKAKVSQAKVNLMNTQNNMEYMKQQLTLQEKQSRNNLINALEQYDNNKRNVEVSQRIYNNYQLKHEQGIVSSLDLIDVNSRYLSAQSDYINSILNLLQSYMELQKMLNNL